MTATIPEDIARRVRMVIVDVDGVLTDGGLYIGRTEEGARVELKRFEITDQLGIKMMGWAGIRVALVSGRPSAASALRADELDIEYRGAPGGYKRVAVEKLIQEHGVAWEEVAVIADDLADLPSLERAGLPVAVSNAVPEVVDAAVWRTGRAGGDGAVREFAEALLRARGEWNERVEAYRRERAGEPE